MIAELGHFILILTLLVALLQAIVPMIGAALARKRHHFSMMAVAAPASCLQAGLLFLAFISLMYGYISSDFSIANVAQNSHSLKPLLYKISGVWGNHEGSLLLWVMILAIFGALVAIFGTHLPLVLKARTLAVQAMISTGFLLFILLTSNPFIRLHPVPIQGRDLNPLLQDPGLAFHPPMLYMGYVGLSITFSFACAALIGGKVDALWARWVRPWTLLSWIFLTAGIALGSWWAYYELGWGGFWFWDPVENASFMPWLAATALLHSAIVAEKRDSLKSWTIFLSIIAFSFSLMGTFLVRSGILTSVHAFATDPDRGIFVLLLLLLSTGGALGLYAWRAPALKAGGLFQPISREGGLVLNNLFLSAGAATVLLGTLYPLFLEVITGTKISVGAPFFNMTFVPMMIPLLLMMGIGPFLTWKRADAMSLLILLIPIIAVSMVLGVLGLVFYGGRSGYAVLGLGISGFVAFATLKELWQRARPGHHIPLSAVPGRIYRLPRAALGMAMAHFGVAVLVAGIMGASLLTSELVTTMVAGEKVVLENYQFEMVEIATHPGPNYTSLTGVFAVRKKGSHQVIAELSAEKRRYISSGQETTEAAIHTRLLEDLYVALGDQTSSGRRVVRIYVKPFAAWLWAGAALLVLGGGLSLSDRRLRVGMAQRHRIVAPAVSEK